MSIVRSYLEEIMPFEPCHKCVFALRAYLVGDVHQEFHQVTVVVVHPSILAKPLCLRSIKLLQQLLRHALLVEWH